MNIIGIVGQLNSGKDTAADHLVGHFGFTKVACADPVKRYLQKVFHFSEKQLWGPSAYRDRLDPRFQIYESPDDGDDAWMAVFRRAERANRRFVEGLLPHSPELRAVALQGLDAWLRNLATDNPQISPRIVLQTLATEWGRSIKGDIWVRQLLRDVNKLLDGGYSYSQQLGLVSRRRAECVGVVVPDIRFLNELKAVKNSGGFLVKINRDNVKTKSGAIANHVSEQEQNQFDDDLFNFTINNNKSLKEFIEAVNIAGFILTGDD